MRLRGGSGYRSGAPTAPSPDARVEWSALSEEQRVAIFGPKCPVIDIEDLRVARAIRVARGMLRPTGGAA
jgi:hypothetical protein